jgi:dihydroneopterin aldolase
MTLAVVKLGGSTAFGIEIAGWITAVAASPLPLVLVPGGGPFADHVRYLQARLGFSDAAAHAMAIVAMDQFGLAIAERSNRFAPARSLDDLRQAIGNGKVPVWLPAAIATQAIDIPRSWDFTSDSLAAWLASGLNADALLLIKQTRGFSEHDTLGDLAARGVVDPCFPSMLPPGIDFYLAGPDDADIAASQLAAGQLPGRLMLPAASRDRKTG